MFEWLINQTEKKFLLNKNNEFLIEELKAAGIEDNNILDAIKKVPRELFVKKDFIKEAYKNIPLPIDCGQTISQPYIVAYMISCLNLKKTELISFLHWPFSNLFCFPVDSRWTLLGLNPSGERGPLPPSRPARWTNIKGN